MIVSSVSTASADGWAFARETSTPCVFCSDCFFLTGLPAVAFCWAAVLLEVAAPFAGLTFDRSVLPPAPVNHDPPDFCVDGLVFVEAIGREKFTELLPSSDSSTLDNLFDERSVGGARSTLTPLEPLGEGERTLCGGC